MLRDGLRSCQGERVGRGEGGVIGGEGTTGFSAAWVQAPLVQIAASPPALVDAGQTPLFATLNSVSACSAVSLRFGVPMDRR
jgi:hypothetical protein